MFFYFPKPYLYIYAFIFLQFRYFNHLRVAVNADIRVKIKDNFRVGLLQEFRWFKQNVISQGLSCLLD